MKKYIIYVTNGYGVTKYAGVCFLDNKHKVMNYLSKRIKLDPCDSIEIIEKEIFGGV